MHLHYGLGEKKTILTDKLYFFFWERHLIYIIFWNFDINFFFLTPKCFMFIFFTTVFVEKNYICRLGRTKLKPHIMNWSHNQQLLRFYGSRGVSGSWDETIVYSCKNTNCHKRFFFQKFDQVTGFLGPFYKRSLFSFVFNIYFLFVTLWAKLNPHSNL